MGGEQTGNAGEMKRERAGNRHYGIGHYVLLCEGRHGLHFTNKEL